VRAVAGHTQVAPGPTVLRQKERGEGFALEGVLRELGEAVEGGVQAAKVIGVLGEAEGAVLDSRKWLEGEHHVEHRDLRRRAGEDEAPARPALGGDDPGADEGVEDLGHIPNGNLGGQGDAFGGGGLVGGGGEP
jgi:hypothetical protein